MGTTTRNSRPESADASKSAGSILCVCQDFVWMRYLEKSAFRRQATLQSFVRSPAWKGEDGSMGPSCRGEWVDELIEWLLLCGFIFFLKIFLGAPSYLNNSFLRVLLLLLLLHVLHITAWYSAFITRLSVPCIPKQLRGEAQASENLNCSDVWVRYVDWTKRYILLGCVCETQRRSHKLEKQKFKRSWMSTSIFSESLRTK